MATKKITLEEVVDNFVKAEEGTVTKKEVKESIKLTKEMILYTVSEMAVDESFTIPDLGTFKLVQSSPKDGKNPRNPQEVIHIPAKQRLKFKCSKAVKDILE